MGKRYFATIAGVKVEITEERANQIRALQEKIRMQRANSPAATPETYPQTPTEPPAETPAVDNGNDDEPGTDRDFDTHAADVQNGYGYYDDAGMFHYYPGEYWD